MAHRLMLSTPGRWLTRSGSARLELAGVGPSRPVVLLLIVLVGCLTVIPLLAVLAASLRPTGLPLGHDWTLAHYASVWLDSRVYGLVLTSLVFAVGSSLEALILGGVLSWLVERTDVPGGRWFRTAILLPIVMPPLLVAIGWVILLSPTIGLLPRLLSPLAGLSVYSLGGMIFVQGLAMVPTAFLFLAPPLRNLDSALEEAGAMSGAPFGRVLRRITLPLLMPPLFSSFVLLVLTGLLTLDIPAVIGTPGRVNVMSTETLLLMQPSSGLPRYGEAGALTSIVFLFLVPTLVVYYRATGRVARFATVTGKAYRPRRLHLGRWRPLGAALVTLYFLLAVVLPVCGLIWVSLVPYFSGFASEIISRLSFGAYAQLAADGRVLAAAGNSILVAAVTAAVLACLSLLVAWAVVRSGRPWGPLLDVLSVVPVGIPHLMMGVALIFVFFTVRAVPIYGTIWIIALGHVVLFLPVTARMCQSAMLQINRELEEAALVSGASRSQTVFRVLLPLVQPAVIAGVWWTVGHSLREFSTAVMLQSGRNQVLSTVLYGFWNTGQAQAAAAIAVLLMGVLAIMVLVAVISGRLFRQVETLL